MDETIQKLIRESVDKNVIHYEALPPLDLYIDQVITLIEQGYSANKKNGSDKPLTKMMINNYSKAGLVRPIKGKKYSREHIVQMLVIYALKGTLSIGEIKQVLDTLYAKPGFDSTAFFACYEKSLSYQQNASSALASLLSSSELFAENDLSGQFASLMAVCAMSDALSELAERMVAQYFEPPAPVKEDKKKPHTAHNTK